MTAEERKELREVKKKLFDKVVALSNGFVSSNNLGVRISYSTGKYTCCYEITWDFLLQARGSSIEQAISSSDIRANYILTKKIMEDKFKDIEFLEKSDSETALQRAEESAFRHFMQWLCGEEDEDHAAAVLFNINMAETIKYKLKNGKSYTNGKKTAGKNTN